MMQQIQSYQDLVSVLNQNDTVYLLLYKKGSETSDCAFSNFEQSATGKDNISFLVADVSEVRDIHGKYGITTVPTLLSFEKSEFKNTYKGCNGADFYRSLFENALFSAESGNENKPKQKPVVVYSTPTCSWCTRLKNYLNENGIKYKDIDVSKDTKAAEEMVKKSGQQGVPQSTIGGQHIVGFDKAKIDKLLNLN